MSKLIDVGTGELKFAKAGDTMVSYAIGSCIVLCAYDPHSKSAAMAHTMLPGRAPEKQDVIVERYAYNALEKVLDHFTNLSIKHNKLHICLLGGANVLQTKHDEICRDNIEFILDYLKKKKLKVKAEALGGEKRRSVKLIVDTGTVYFSEGDSCEYILYEAKKRRNFSYARRRTGTSISTDS